MVSLREIESIGRRTREWIVDEGTCPLLKAYRISMVGISEALPGFRFVRARPTMSVLMAATKGQGVAYISDEFQDFKAGTAYLMPNEVLHAYAATGRSVWRVCWVCYVDPTAELSIISGDRPKLVYAHGEQLDEAIYGLYRETTQGAKPSIQKLYIDLIHEYALRIAQDLNTDERLIRLWKTVEEDLKRSWTLDQIARVAGMSIESLRILCERSTGRSPMKHLTFLRMQHAAKALSSTQKKISLISEEVGFNDPFAFSVAFKRSLGVSPRDYRTRRKKVSIH
jgi:AraC-like DNA-binding protein